MSYNNVVLEYIDGIIIKIYIKNTLMPLNILSIIQW